MSALVHCRPILIEDVLGEDDSLQLIEFRPNDCSRFGTFRGKLLRLNFDFTTSICIYFTFDFLHAVMTLRLLLIY